MIGGMSFFFAGGGTGGHIYPALALAEQIIKMDASAKIHFFCSSRGIDSRILTNTGFEYTALPVRGFSLRPRGLIEFCNSFLKGYRIAREIIGKSTNAVVIGVGGFVSAPVCMAGHKLKVPVKLLNVDIVAGRANKLTARWADEIFVQFPETARCFSKAKARIHALGCPLRISFANPDPQRARLELGVDENKKILLVTGGSSGAQNINNAVCSVLNKLNVFADDWQIVHLAGVDNYEQVRDKYAESKITGKVLGYYDNMADLLNAADLVIGRSGAVSVAEYAAAMVPSICMPYPYHKDRHQYLNAEKLVQCGAGVIVDDLENAKERAERLWGQLRQLMKDDSKREEMKRNCVKSAKIDASVETAKKLMA